MAPGIPRSCTNQIKLCLARDLKNLGLGETNIEAKRERMLKVEGLLSSA